MYLLQIVLIFHGVELRERPAESAFAVRIVPRKHPQVTALDGDDSILNLFLLSVGRVSMEHCQHLHKHKLLKDVDSDFFISYVVLNAHRRRADEVRSEADNQRRIGQFDLNVDSSRLWKRLDNSTLPTNKTPHSFEFPFQFEKSRMSSIECEFGRFWPIDRSQFYGHDTRLPFGPIRFPLQKKSSTKRSSVRKLTRLSGFNGHRHVAVAFVDKNGLLRRTCSGKRTLVPE